MDAIDGIKIRALASIMDPDHDDILADVYEWYSEKFCTPLHIVPDIPLDDVLFAYFRHLYRNMQPEERHNMAIWLLETPEERAKRIVEVKSDEEEFLRKAAEHNDKKKKPSAAAETFAKLQSRLKDKAAFIPKADLPPIQPEPEGEEEVKITYMSQADFEAELDKTPGPPRKKKT